MATTSADPSIQAPAATQRATANADEAQPDTSATAQTTETTGANPGTNAETSDKIPLPAPLRADSTLQSAAAAFDEYMLRKGFSDNTIKAFRNDLKILLGFLGPETKLHQVATRDLEDFLSWLQNGRGKPCSPKTLTRRITTLKVFFSWVHGIGVIGTDPAEPVVQQSARTPLPKVLRDEEVSRILRAAQDYLWDRKKPDARPYLLVTLLLQTGMKKAECANLLVSDIEITPGNAPEVVIRYPDERNSHKNRRLALHPSFVPALNQYLEQYKPETYLFDCTPRNLEYVLDEVGQRAGIKSAQVGFEILRWTCAVRDFRTGTPEERLREKLGLSKISWRETRDKIYRLTGVHP